jgi:hypothetical protein
MFDDILSLVGRLCKGGLTRHRHKPRHQGKKGVPAHAPTVRPFESLSTMSKAACIVKQDADYL